MSVELVGPFSSQVVLVNGYRVPFLTAEPANGGKVLLTLDDNTAFHVDVADLDVTVSFIADCIAVASGYACHPGAPGGPEPVRRSTYRQWIGIHPND